MKTMKSVGKMLRIAESLFLLFMIIPVSTGNAQIEAAAKAPANPMVNQDMDMDLKPSPLNLERDLLKGMLDETKDHQAKIVMINGDAKILKKGAADWASAQKDMAIEQGDQLLTAETGSIQIAYDSHFLNIAKIDSNTKAEFRSIEPTDLFLEDGSIFSALDGLEKGRSYQVSTPTAVAAVRGTHFIVDYNSGSGAINAATLSVPEDNHDSKIELTDVKEGGSLGDSVFIREGQQLDLASGQVPSDTLLHDVKPEFIEQAKQVFQDLGARVDGFNEIREKGREVFENHFQGRETENAPLLGDSDSRRTGDKPNDGGNNQGGNGPGFGGPHDPNNMMNHSNPIDKTGAVDNLVDGALANNTVNPKMLMGNSSQDGFFNPNGPVSFDHIANGQQPPSTNPFLNPNQTFGAPNSSVSSGSNGFTSPSGTGYQPGPNGFFNLDSTGNQVQSPNFFNPDPNAPAGFPPSGTQGFIPPDPSMFPNNSTTFFDPNAMNNPDFTSQSYGGILPPPPPPPTTQFPDPYAQQQFCQQNPGSAGC